MAVLLQINALQKTFGPTVVFEGLTLSIGEKQKIGVIGRNGAGKSTLFRIIIGEEEATSGDVQIHDRTRIGYLRQHDDQFSLDESIIDFLMRSSGKEEWVCAKLASQFHLTKEMLTRPIGSFAGGYRMRVKLVDMLLREPNLLLLDEPTNYLDLSTLLLLEQFLQTYNGSFLLISHDREFLKRTCPNTLEIDRKKATLYPGPIESYFEYKQGQIELAKRHNKKLAREKRHLQSFVDRFRYKASKASQAQSKLKQIDRLEFIEIAHPMSSVRIQLPRIEEKKGFALSSRALSIGYPEKTVATDVHLDINRGEHIAIVGDNGQGKTTFLKTIAGAIPLLSGTFKWAPKLSIGYYAQHVPQMLHADSLVKEHLAEMAGPETSDEEILQMAGNFLFRDHELEKPISVLSGGEKARLCLAGLLLQKNDVLLLDEPTNHLDFETVEALAAGLRESNATILFVSHNRTFVNEVATGIIEVNNGKVKKYLHDYENYVYHLKEVLDIARAQVQEEKPAMSTEKLQRKELYPKLKEAKKQLREVELEMAAIERRKQNLLAWFEKHPTEYNQLKMDDLNKTNEELGVVEARWEQVQREVDGLEGQLNALQ